MASRVTRIGESAFYDCSNLTSVTLSSNLITIGDLAFSGCSRLTNVAIPNSVTSVGYSAFRTCFSLIEITIPQSLTTIGAGAFSGCDSLISITVDAMNPAYSSFDGVLLNKNQTTLIHCPSAKAGTFVVPASVITIGNNAFYKCTNLSAIAVDTRNGYYTSVGGVLFNKSQTILIQCPGGKIATAPVPATVTNIAEYAFYNCIGLAAIDVDSLNPLYSSIDGVLFNKSQTVLIRCPPAKTGSYAIPATATNLGNSAFFNCSSLTNILIPQSVIRMEDSVFDGCTGLDAINANALNPVYSSLDGVLFNKTQTMLVQCPKGRSGSYAVPQGVTVISNAAFFGCTKLASVTVPESLTQMCYRSFFYCNSLRAIYCKCNVPLSNAPLFTGTDVTIYYLPGTVGWKSTFEYRPTALWNPEIQTAAPDFGVWPQRLRLTYHRHTGYPHPHRSRHRPLQRRLGAAAKPHPYQRIG